MTDRAIRWPDSSTPGIFRLFCTCGRFSFAGTVEECNKAVRNHDDSPLGNHVVRITDAEAS